MKKQLLALAILASGGATAQFTDTCEVWFNDTVTYIDAKTSAYSGISINDNNDVNAPGYGYAGYAQRFEAPDTVTVEGVCFYGVMDTGGSFAAAVKMYDTSGNLPGSMVAGTSHVVPYTGGPYTGAMNDASILQCAMFPAPIQWEGEYYVGIENLTSTDMYLARNATGNGATEDLMCFYYKGVSDPSYDGWYNSYSVYGAQWDFDVIIRPIVSYKGQSIVTFDTTLCLGDTIRIDYEFSLDDSLMHNKFYNPNFASYSGSSSTTTFDYGDLTPVSGDTFHVYAAGGMYTGSIETSSTVSGWSSLVFDATCGFNVEIVDPSFDIVDENACDGDTVYFIAPADNDSYTWNDMSTNDSLVVDTDGMTNGEYTYYVDVLLKGCAASDTMLLNLGDLLVDLGSDTTLCLNQNLTLTAGVYDSYDWNTGQTTQSIQLGPFTDPGAEEVVLTVAQGNCTGADTVLVTIDDCLGVDDKEAVTLNLFPNPSNGYFNVDASEQIKSIKVMNLSGQVVREEKVVNQKVLDLTDMTDGTYLLEVETSFGKVYKKIQIIRWNSLR